MNITLEQIIAKLPIEMIKQSIRKQIEPMKAMLPDKRLGRVIENLVLGILGGQTPVIAGIARHNSKEEGDSWAVAKRIYRFLDNKRMKTQDLYEGLYQIGQQTVEQENPDYLVVAVDPVNFEKPYAKAVEGVSTVHKATPPDLNGQARLAHGYPSITATIVNTKVPVTSYANWFSYVTDDFVSQNKEIEQAFTTTHRLYPQYSICFVGDSGFDDQKIFAQIGQLKQTFIFRVQHHNRMVEVYNERMDRWEKEKLEDLVACVPYQVTFQVLIKHAGENRLAAIQFGWLKVRIPDTDQSLWVLVADDQTLNRQLVLITNIPIDNLDRMRQIYNDWRLRPRIEHGYRFDQEQGLDVEDMRVRTINRMQRLFAFVLLAAQIVFVIGEQWPPEAVLWLRQLGGKLGLPTDRDGPYWLLQGIAAVIISAMTLSFIFLHPFPSGENNYG